jgi:hypothetical protein
MSKQRTDRLLKYGLPIASVTVEDEHNPLGNIPCEGVTDGTLHERSKVPIG